MNTSCKRFLKNLIAKGGQQSYVALLMLAAIERNEKELLKRIDFSIIQSNLKKHNHLVIQNQAS